MEPTVSAILAAGAVGGFAVTAITCWLLIPALHRLHFGQTIREEGPTWHNKKNGTPTMGGLGFIFGILLTIGVVYGVFHSSAPEVLGPQQMAAGMLVLFLAFGNGLIGFLDDFIKVIKHRHLGLTGSMFFGGMVTALAFVMDRPELVLFFGIVYIWDAMTVVIQRIYFKATHGKRIFKMTPIHHAFELRGWKEVKIDGFFALIAAIGVAMGIFYICIA